MTAKTIIVAALITCLTIYYVSRFRKAGLPKFGSALAILIAVFLAAFVFEMSTELKLVLAGLIAAVMYVADHLIWKYKSR